jgi:regulator of nucleoside diphosphate kinase
MFPIITDLDAARIRDLGTRLPGGGDRSGLNRLIDLVDTEAEIVPHGGVDHDVVTVNSLVSFRDEVTGGVHKVTLVYPDDANIAERRISILSPVGSALLGRRVGARTAFITPDGAHRDLRLLELHYQPEAAGHRGV